MSDEVPIQCPSIFAVGESVLPPKQAGTTTNQMLNAPKGAFYLWLDHDTAYAKRLAHKLRRLDLRIYSIRFALERGGQILLGSRHAIVLDHACQIKSAEEAEVLNQFDRAGRIPK